MASSRSKAAAAAAATAAVAAMRSCWRARRSASAVLTAATAAAALLLLLLALATPATSASLQPALPTTLDPDPTLFLGLDSVLQKSAHGKICQPTGLIDDARCDFETVEALNGELFASLHRLVRTPYFRFYRIDLYRECPFWTENSFCMNRACGVEEADESEIPEQFRTSQLSSVSSVDAGTNELLSASDDDANYCYWDDTTSSEAQYVDLIKNPERFTGYAGPSASRVWKSIYEENCFGLGSPFVEPPRSGEAGAFVSRETLLGSSLRASGSGGKTAGGSGGGLASSDNSDGEVSSAFRGLLSSLEGPVDKGDSETCLEKRVFYRIISGLHASISIHVCAEYLDQRTGEWAPNLECFVTRIAQHPERLQNVYFNYVLLLRALARLDGGWLDGLEIGTGTGVDANAPWNLSTATGSATASSASSSGAKDTNSHSADEDPSSATLEQLEHASDSLTQQHLAALISAAQASPPTFDEQSMFSPSNPEGEQLRTEFRQRFRNISAIMDCVGCDKCRLWGKVQVNGLGTALKILFSDSDSDADSDADAGVGGRGGGVDGASRRGTSRRRPSPLMRSELVALINTAHRFAESLRAVTVFREMYQHALASKEAELRDAKSERERPDRDGKGSASSSSAAAPSERETSSRSTATAPEAVGAKDAPSTAKDAPRVHDEL